MCEQQIEGNGGDVDPSIVMTSDGTVIVLSLTNGGVLVSRNDGCTFERPMGPLQGNRGVDLTLDPSRPGRVLVLMSTIVKVLDAGYPSFRNFLAQTLDNGQSWEVLAELPDDMIGEALEIAPSDPKRIYVSGTLNANALQGVVQRSDDGGLTWKRTMVELPRGSGSLFISGIHPRDPDRLWFRVPGRGDVFGIDPARLWVSADGAASFEPVAQTKAGMLGFALSPDGDRIAFGGPLDGLLVAPADASAAPTKVSDLRVNCLRWSPNGLYVCGSEPVDPYSLAYAAEPTQGFAPLWHRANTCRDACPEQSTLEMKCRDPWEALAPLVGADKAMCTDSAPLLDAGVKGQADAGSRALDGGTSRVVDAALTTPPPTAAPPKPSSAGGCTVTSRHDVGGPTWLALVMLSAAWRHRRRLQATMREL
jgi:MYXO-CTERM domain-containing protein